MLGGGGNLPGDNFPVTRKNDLIRKIRLILKIYYVTTWLTNNYKTQWQPDFFFFFEKNFRSWSVAYFQYISTFIHLACNKKQYKTFWLLINIYSILIFQKRVWEWVFHDILLWFYTRNVSHLIFCYLTKLVYWSLFVL